MSQKIVMLRMRVKEGKEQEALEVMTKHQAATHTEEGNRLYAVCVDAEDPRWMIMIQIYDDEAALQAHMAAPTFSNTLDAGGPLFVGGNDAVDVHWLNVQPSASPKGTFRGDK